MEASGSSQDRPVRWRHQVEHGPDKAGHLPGQGDEDHRNKIFHGQLTALSLNRQDLVDLATDINFWCTSLGAGADAEVGYDGFGRNSFQKSAMPDLWKCYKVQFDSVADYQAFIRAHMEGRG